MRINFMVSGLAAALVLSGCVDLSTPESTLGSAFHAVKENKLKRLKKTLEGSALEEFGTKEGLATLNAMFDKYNVSMGQKALIESAKDRFGREVSQTYSVNVHATEKGMISLEPQMVLEASVNCTIDYEYVPCAPDWIADSWCYADVLWDGQWCYNSNDIRLGSRHRVFCRNGYEPVVNTQTTCKISELEG